MDDLLDEVIDEVMGKSKKKWWILLIVLVIGGIAAFNTLKHKNPKGTPATLAGDAASDVAASVSDAAGDVADATS